jgi:hypothetical protein
MKLQLRQKSKREQALDAFASVAKTWSEWHLGKKVTTTAAKGAKQAAKVKGSGNATKLKIAGAVAVVGGLGAAVAKKLKGGQAEPLYTPPGPAPDMESPPPSPIVVEDLTEDPSAGDTRPVPPTPEPAITASIEPPPAPDYVPDTPVVVEDLADEPPAAAPAAPAEYVADIPVVVDDLAGEAPAEPEDLVSDPAPEPADDDEPVTPADPDAETPPDPGLDSAGDDGIDEIRRR